MPLVRYELRSEHAIANPELHKRVLKTDAQALFESITMCALAGLVRQLGELSEFAAEMFGDLHDEIMALSRRGRKLHNRVEKLEAKVPVAEKFVFMETDQLRFAFMPSLEWTSSICVDQSHFTRGELPAFIKKSYDDSNGPPRFYLLDKFDVQGPGASLKRYTDPSFFRREWTKSHLSDAEKLTPSKAKQKESKHKIYEPSSSLRSLLETSKFIHSVRRLEDSYLEPDPGLKQMRTHSKTLKISAAEIEATLGKSPGGNSQDRLTSSGSPDHFVDALASIDMEAAKDSWPGVSTTETKTGLDERLEPSRKELRVSTSTKASSSSAADSPLTISELSTDSELVSYGIANKESCIYSSTSSSFSSPESPEFHASASSSSPGSDKPNRTFSALEAPMSPLEPSAASSVLSSIFSTMRELLPASPTPGIFTSTQELQDCMPPPPPLPPLKWRLSKSPATSSTSVPTPPPLPLSTSPSLGGVTVSEHRDLLQDAISSRTREKLRKVNSHGRARSFDSRDVLLEQIRTRSFHLKHTAAQEKNGQSRPSTPSDTNVTAILEKATAIRQALEGSEEDDEW